MRPVGLLLGMVALVAAAALSGCDKYQKPYKALPEDFEIVGLDGTRVRKEDLLGKPWLINIWVPG